MTNNNKLVEYFKVMKLIILVCKKKKREWSSRLHTSRGYMCYK